MRSERGGFVRALRSLSSVRAETLPGGRLVWAGLLASTLSVLAETLDGHCEELWA